MMGRCLRACVVLGLLYLAVLTWPGVKADEQKADDNACTYFHAMDYVYDNVLTYVDFACDVLRRPLTAANGKMITDVKRQLNLLGLILTAFPLTEKGPVENILQGGVKLERYLQGIQARRYTPAFKTEIQDLCTLILQYFNYDGDDTSLARWEWQIFMNMFTVTKEEATTAFNKMDRNGDNMISFSEYYAAGLDYYINGSDANSAWFCGPPTTCEAVRQGAGPVKDPIALGLVSLPTAQSLGGLKLLDLLLHFAPQFDFLKGVFEPLNILPSLLRGVLGI